jgi:ADP-heptose:LPS heptosyltransferase
MTHAQPLASENKAKWSTIEKAAWVRVGALGDLLVGLASLQEMHEFFPKAKITVVGPKLWTEILDARHFDWIDTIFVVERKKIAGVPYRNVGGKWTPDSYGQRVQEFLKPFGAVVNTNIDSARYGIEARLAGVPLRIGSATFGTSLLYTHTSPYFGKDPLIHERDAALLLLEYATPGWFRHFRSTDSNRRALDHWISSSSLVKKWRGLGLPAAKKPSRENAEKLTGAQAGRYLLVNPTSSRREKAWPSEKFREFLLKSRPELEKKNLTAIVIGSSQETEWLREVAGEEFKIVQPPTISDLQDIVGHAKALLTNTSSMQFIAASQSCPCVTLMGRARPEIWGPLGPNDRIVEGKPPMELASDIFLQEQEGYRSIAVDSVLGAVIALPAI